MVSDWNMEKEVRLREQNEPALKKENFSRCTIAEILDFKLMVEEIYGLGVFEKTVGEDIAILTNLIKAKKKMATKGTN